MVLVIVLLGSLGITASAFMGQDTSGVSTTTTAAAQRADTGTHATSTTYEPAPSTTSVVTTTAPPATTTTTRVAPATTLPTAPPATTVPTTAVLTAGMQMSPSTADFPTTPPPYWPMPIVHVTITNTGGAAIDALVVHPVGVYSVPSNSCSALAPGQSCAADIQFCPSAPGQYTNTLVVTGEDAVTGAPLQDTATLQGTAT